MSWNVPSVNNPLVTEKIRKQSNGGTNRILNLRSSVLLLALLSVWFLLSYLCVSSFIDKHFLSALQQHSTELGQTAAAVKYHFDRSITFLHVLPATVADDMAVMTALRSFDYHSLGDIDTPESKLSFLNSRNDLVALNHHLAEQQMNLDVNVIWILAPNGDCIASSNFDQSESFVGVSYSDRGYFKTAMTGQMGRQYAVGRQTNIPGLFFSAPILDGGNIIGVVIIKIDISKFSQWLNRFNCFISDSNGVIILSSDKSLENYALVDAPIFRMSSEARDRQYKRNDFSVLKIGRFERESSYLTISLPRSDSFYLLSRSQPSDDGYTLFTYTKIVEAESLRKTKWQITILVFVSGAALILLIAGVRLYLRDMRESLAAAEAANNAKSAFLANMSHEIRTPMNAILGMSYLALQSDLTSKQREQITFLHDAAESLLGIINDILDFSKVESGKMTLDEGPFVLSDTLNEVIRLLKPKMKEKLLEFNYAEQDQVLAQNMPLLVGDELRLRQILINLLSNAIKFTEKGFVRLGFSSSTSENMIRLLLTIQDSGIGMNGEQVTQLFEEFTQADTSTTRPYGGTGLGMAIVWKFVALMGGTINVESQIGKGSCFTVDIPFKVALVGQIPLKERRQIIENYDALCGIRVLLVEDNPVNRLLAVELLAMKGVITDTAENGEVAVHKLQSVPAETFGAVFMDLQMPVLDGYEASRIIRSDSRFNTLPIIALSAHAMSSEKEHCSQIGMNGYISKPFDPEHLWHALMRATRKNVPLQVMSSSQQAQEPDQSMPEISINGVDVRQGIKRAGGDRNFYAKLVQEVLNNFASGYEDLLGFALRKESKGGHAHAHKLRGVFGAIGAQEMQEAMVSIEESFRIDHDPSQMILALENTYAALMEDLSRYVESVGSQKAEGLVSQSGGSVVDVAWLKTFTDHLGKGDFKAIELWESNKTSLEGRFSPTDFEHIGKALQVFDFVRALEYFTNGTDL